MNVARIKDISLEWMQKWFMDLKIVIEEYNILPENIYNINESGFEIGEVEASKSMLKFAKSFKKQREDVKNE